MVRGTADAQRVASAIARGRVDSSFDHAEGLVEELRGAVDSRNLAVTQIPRTPGRFTLVDPAACRTYADTASGRVDERVREESGQGPKHANPLH